MELIAAVIALVGIGLIIQLERVKNTIMSEINEATSAVETASTRIANAITAVADELANGGSVTDAVTRLQEVAAQLNAGAATLEAADTNPPV